MGMPGGIEFFLILAVLLGSYIYILIDILRSDFGNSINKLIWLIVLFVLPFIGAILYLLIGRKQKIVQTNEKV